MANAVMDGSNFVAWGIPPKSQEIAGYKDSEIAGAIPKNINSWYHDAYP